MKRIYTFAIALVALLLSIGTLAAQEVAGARAASTAHHTTGEDPDIIEFAIITDTHRYGPTADRRESAGNIEAFVTYCALHPELQFALYGGDFMNSYDTDHEQAMWCLERSREDFAGLKIPFYTTKGNHDCNGKQWKDNRPDNSQIITDREYFELFSPVSESNPLRHPEGIVVDPENPKGNYYYRDFERQRFRLIMLNNYDRDTMEYYGYHGQQMKWLAEVALDFGQKKNPTDWCFLIVGHAFSINHASNPITRLLHAYVRGQDFSDTDFGVPYTGHYNRVPRAKMVSTFGGHFHEDFYWNWDGYNMISFSRGFATDGETSPEDRLCFDHIIINTRTFEIIDRRIGRGHDRRFSYDKPVQLEPTLSFPDADGLGAYTQGGNGGRIVHVSNLDDHGTGSLRWAIDQQGCHTVVFDVEGTISLISPLVVRTDSLTIAGQTSPGRGITLEGEPMQIQASNVVVRYLTLHNGLTDGDFGQRGLMLDHLTASTAQGSAIAIYRTEDVTLQDCVINGQPGNDAPGLVAGGFKATYYHNLITDCNNAIKIPDLEGCNRWIHIVRNVIENWGDHAVYGGGRQGEASVEDNYMIPGEQTRTRRFLEVAPDGTGRYYVQGNTMKGYENLTRRNAEMVSDRSAVPYWPNPADTLDRHKMSPVQRPHDIDFAKSCLVIAAFHNKPIFKHPTPAYTRNMLHREAGSQYRPQAVCADSLLSGDIEGYTKRLVERERSIVILYENDVHCNISEYPYLTGLRDLMAADTAWVGITSSGDFLQGGLLGSISQGQAIVDVMQRVDYDAITVGNHEFDFPLSHTRKLLHDIGSPVVCANLRDLEQDTLVFAPYVIQQYGRRKVAYVGVTTPTIEESNYFALKDETGQRTIYDLSRRDLYRRVQQAVDQARQEGADYVIVLSHLGEKNESGFTSHKLIAATRGIDAVLDGHTHSVVPSLHVNNRDGKPVLITQTGTQFANIGKLVIDPDGHLYSELIDTHDLVFPDPTTAHLVECVQDEFLSDTNSVIGTSKVTWRRYNLWRQPDNNPQEINAGDLVTDAMRYTAHAEAAWLNPGSIRKGLHSGDLTRADIIELLPYDNYLCTLDITGNQIYKMVNELIRDLKHDEEKITPLSGLRLTLKSNKKKYSIDRLEIIDPATGEYVDVDPKRTYTIATTDYCLNIGWKMQIMLRNAQVHKMSIKYSEATTQYIIEQLGGKIDAKSIQYKDRVSVTKN